MWRVALACKGVLGAAEKTGSSEWSGIVELLEANLKLLSLEEMRGNRSAKSGPDNPKI